MKYLLIVIVIPIFVSAQNSLKEDDSLSQFKDTIKIEDVAEKQFPDKSDDSLFEKYQSLIGAFIGALFASLIAIYSIRKTHKNQIYLENQKIFNRRHIEEKVYCGFIFAIYSVLLNHKEISKALKKELNAFSKNVESTGDLIIEKPYNRFSIDFLKECVLKTLSYQNYDSDTILFLVTYVNKLENFDSNLNFIPLLKIRDKFQDIKLYSETVKHYFSDLFGLINLLDELNDKITKLILDYLRKSEAVNMHEYLESLHNKQL